MSTDLTTKFLLAGILGGLLLLVVQGLRDPAAESELGRYRIEQLMTRRNAPVVVRVDTTTGRLWRTEGFPGEARWVEVPEPGAAD